RFAVSQVARAPGRVNLIGDHTDYTGGLVLPMAIDRHTTIEFERSDDVSATSSNFDGEVRFGLPVGDAAAVQPAWGRYIAGVAAAMSERNMTPRGFTGTVTTTVPIGGGLSSSAALEVAAALAFGIDADATTIAAVCRRAEHLATNVPCGIMDQLTSVAGVKDHALLIDCHSLDVTPIRIPESLAVWVVEISSRTLDGSEYPARVAQCAVAEREIGPLRLADVQSVNRLVDPIVRARARHVVTENERVRQFAAALMAGDFRAAGQLMIASHASLRDDFATSTTQMDAAVEHFSQVPGVYGVRMTGGGFGGCIVVLGDADADIDDAAIDGMRVHAADGASLTTPLS
ncbi:MAG: galactokinase, partial [Ilumatobacteraceae bacterium]|nr:galactokinase [Ilumatobacteraceae bacterium]